MNFLFALFITAVTSVSWRVVIYYYSQVWKRVLPFFGYASTEVDGLFNQNRYPKPEAISFILWAIKASVFLLILLAFDIQDYFSLGLSAVIFGTLNFVCSHLFTGEVIPDLNMTKKNRHGLLSFERNLVFLPLVTVLLYGPLVQLYYLEVLYCKHQVSLLQEKEGTLSKLILPKKVDKINHDGKVLYVVQSYYDNATYEFPQNEESKLVFERPESKFKVLRQNLVRIACPNMGRVKGDSVLPEKYVLFRNPFVL